MLKQLTLAMLLSSLPLYTFATPNKTLANTPPMGWSSWNHFGLGIDDATVRAQADAMVTSGMRDAGYVYINIDDGWEGERDANGILRPNNKFPDMKALANYVHSKGLKLGIYSSPGPKTCGGYEGSYQHEEQDAQTFAAWGIDYLKYDLCSFFNIILEEENEQRARQLLRNAYIKMHQALQKTGRPIVFSLCEYGIDDVWQWGATVGGNLWRTTGDIEDNYKSMARIGFGQAGLSSYAGPGHWNDPDMLEVGNGGMTTDEYQTHISLWALLAAPLFAGNDLTHMTAETIALLTNAEVLAIDQDLAGKQGEQVYANDDIEIWARTLADGSQAVGLFNRSQSPQDIQLSFKDIGFNHPVKVRDIWLHKDLGVLEKQYQTMVTAHGVVLLKITS
ncbi:MAG: alpha-galactosidase [Gammaproteobacteria bacterium RIFCSPHIGHO2_12_FULL_41_20]|nr:MAG: alpha-galactosidase [Gammaproteobacteria bacterium RIFCSPHIGHO2_12_FULL_41_20]